MLKAKILEFGDELSLPCKHMNLYFQNRRWDVECLALKGRSASDMNTWLPYMEEGALAVRFKTEESQEIIAQFPHLPTDVRWLETADVLMREADGWWPRLLVYETLRKLVIQRFSSLNIGLQCYVIGATRLGRAAVAAMASLGFSNISIIDEDEVLLAREVKNLSRYLLGINIQAVPAGTLTIQTKSGSLMVNTLRLQDESVVLKDLSYFNFMSQGGVVVDISECCHRNLLLEEAERADLQVLTGLEVQAQVDVNLLTKLFPDLYVTFDDYFESFSDHLESIK